MKDKIMIEPKFNYNIKQICIISNYSIYKFVKYYNKSAQYHNKSAQYHNIPPQNQVVSTVINLSFDT